MIGAALTQLLWSGAKGIRKHTIQLPFTQLLTEVGYLLYLKTKVGIWGR